MNLKYKQKRKLVEFTCDYCNSKNTKPESEFKRNIKLGRHNFCSRSCAIKYAQANKLTNSDNWRNSTINKQNLLNNCNNRKNEFTPFNYTFRNVKHRFKEYNITVQDLKEIWENQKGICPYTGLSLILPTYKNLKEIPISLRASLDRIDSSKGYTKDNIQFISTPINYLKNTMSDSDTKQYLKSISKYIFTFVEY